MGRTGKISSSVGCSQGFVQRKRISLVLVVVFAALYYIGRVAIFYSGATGNMEYEQPQSVLVENVVSYSFLAIGVIGLLMLPGVFFYKQCGFWGTIAVSAYTIVFDIWAFLLVQSSAAIGIVPAALVMGCLFLMRRDFLDPKC